MKYVHDVESKICVAYTPANDNMPVGSSKIFKMTTVLCHKNDQYNKKTARNLAELYMNTTGYILVRVPKSVSPNMFFKNISDSMSNHQEIGLW